MVNGKVINPNGEPLEVCSNSYYVVQYGLCLGVAFFSADTWCFTGAEPMLTSELKFDMVVFNHLLTHEQLLHKTKQ